MLYYLLSVIHLFLCIVLIFFILIQNSKGMGLSGAFGAAGGSDSVFGSSGGINILMKITIGLAIIFTLSSIALNMIGPPDTRSLVGETVEEGGSLTEMVEQQPSEEPAQQAPAGEGAAAGSQDSDEGLGELLDPEP